MSVLNGFFSSVGTAFWAVMAFCNFDLQKGHGHRVSTAIAATIDTLATVACGWVPGSSSENDAKARARARKELGYARHFGDVDAAIASQESIVDGCSLVRSLCRAGSKEEAALPYWVVAVANGELRFDEVVLKSCAKVRKKAKGVSGLGSVLADLTPRWKLERDPN